MKKVCARAGPARSERTACGSGRRAQWRAAARRACGRNACLHCPPAAGAWQTAGRSARAARLERQRTLATARCPPAGQRRALAPAARQLKQRLLPHLAQNAQAEHCRGPLRPLSAEQQQTAYRYWVIGYWVIGLTYWFDSLA